MAIIVTWGCSVDMALQTVEVRPWPGAPIHWGGDVLAWHFKESYDWPSLTRSAKV
jgi:hypothetical protein